MHIDIMYMCVYVCLASTPEGNDMSGSMRRVELRRKIRRRSIEAIYGIYIDLYVDMHVCVYACVCL